MAELRRFVGDASVTDGVPILVEIVMSVSVTIIETQWTISRQPPVGAGARAEGDRLPQIPESGLWFHSDKAESVFYPMSYRELPTEDQLISLPLERIAEMLKAARSRAGTI